MSNLQSLSLRIFPGRRSTSYALTWRSEGQTTHTDRRLTWGVLPFGRNDLADLGVVDLLGQVVNDMRRKRGDRIPPGGAREPLGAVGGIAKRALGLPGIDSDA